MKKIIYCFLILCTLVGVSSCSSDKEDGLPMIFIENARYSLATGSVEIKATTELAPTQPMKVAVSLAGNAQLGVDFSLSQEEFVFQPGETEALIQLERIKENIGESSKELVINLRDEPAGYQLGLMNYTVVELLGNQGVIMSFVSAEGALSLLTKFAINLETMDGLNYKVASETSFRVEVDPASTAIEGEHFVFVDGPYATVAQRQSEGDVGVHFLKREAGKDKLVLRLANKEGYALGSHDVMTIKVQGPSLLAGKWRFDSLANRENLEISWGMMTDIDKLPIGSTDDWIEFVGDTYTKYAFTPHLVSDYKNYFGTEQRGITFADEVDKLFHEGSSMRPPVIRVSQYDVPGVNINFSASHTTVRSAAVYFRLIEVNKEEVLECTIEDFSPTDFLTEILAGMGNMEYTPLRLHFKRMK